MTGTLFPENVIIVVSPCSHSSGVARVHVRRAMGRRRANPGVMVRGLIHRNATVMICQQIFHLEDLQPTD